MHILLVGLVDYILSLTCPIERPVKFFFRKIFKKFRWQTEVLQEIKSLRSHSNSLFIMPVRIVSRATCSENDYMYDPLVHHPCLDR